MLGIAEYTVKQRIAYLLADSFRINFALTNRIGSNHNRQKNKSNYKITSMCKTEQKPNETALLRKVVDGLKQELEKVKNVVYASKEVLNLEEAALFLGISKSSLYKMTHNQVIPYFKPNNKMVYFEKSELLKWLRQNPVASQGQISEEANAIMQNLAKND